MDFKTAGRTGMAIVQEGGFHPLSHHGAPCDTALLFHSPLMRPTGAILFAGCSPEIRRYALAFD